MGTSVKMSSLGSKLSTMKDALAAHYSIPARAAQDAQVAAMLYHSGYFADRQLYQQHSSFA